VVHAPCHGCGKYWLWAAATGQWLLRHGFQVAVHGIALHRNEIVYFIMVWHETAARRRGGEEEI